MISGNSAGSLVVGLIFDAPRVYSGPGLSGSRRFRAARIHWTPQFRALWVFDTWRICYASFIKAWIFPKELELVGCQYGPSGP